MMVDGLVGGEEYLFQILETCIRCWYLFTSRDTEEEGMWMPVLDPYDVPLLCLLSARVPISDLGDMHLLLVFIYM